VRDSEILAGAWSKTLLADGVRVVRIDRGVFEEGRVLWLRIYGAPSSWYARNVAERFGTITESDEAEDGARSFSVVRPAAVES
jgi:hypothetical protein